MRERRGSHGFARAVVAFVAMPGIVAFAVPLLWSMWTGATRWVHPAGALLLLGGTAGLLRCVRDFYVAGQGTLAPWSPPVRLVVIGLYRWSRNPMYLAVLAVLAGWATLLASRALTIYALAIALAFELRVVFGEEPWLDHRYGAAWRAYCGRVRRWL